MDKTRCSRSKGPEFNPESGNYIRHAKTKTSHRQINKTNNIKKNNAMRQQIHGNQKDKVMWDLRNMGVTGERLIKNFSTKPITIPG